MNRPLLWLAAGAVLASALAGGAQAGPERPPRVNYILRCTGCHGMEGAGSEQAGIPDFRGYVGTFARSGDGRLYLMHVPGVTNASLGDGEIAAVMNFVIESFAAESRDPAAPAFTAAEVTALRARPVADVVALRRSVAAAAVAQGWPVAGYPWP